MMRSVRAYVCVCMRPRDGEDARSVTDGAFALYSTISILI